MALSNLVTSDDFAGDGSTVNFAIPFTFFNNTQVKVKLTGSGGVVTYWTSGVEYTISGGDPGTTVVAGTAPAVGETLTVYRSTPLTQIYDFLNASPLDVENVEKALDRLAMMIQETTNTLSSSGIFGFYSQTTQTVNAAATITIDETKQRLIVPVQGNAAPVTANTTTAVENGTIDGQELLLRGAHATNSVTISGSSTNMEMNGSMVLVAFSTLSLVWNGTTSKWTEVARSN